MCVAKIIPPVLHQLPGNCLSEVCLPRSFIFISVPVFFQIMAIDVSSESDLCLWCHELCVTLAGS